MSDRTTTLRLKRVRFKNGATVEVLRDGLNERVVAEFDRHIAWMRGRTEKLAGYCVFTWDAAGRGRMILTNSRASQIPNMWLPDLLRAEVQDYLTRVSAVDDVREFIFGERPPA
jgi:hypothetical protein